MLINVGDTRLRFKPWIRKNSLELGKVTHSSILAWKIPWTEEPGGLWGPKDSNITGHAHARACARARAHTHTHTRMFTVFFDNANIPWNSFRVKKVSLVRQSNNPP